MQARPAGPHRRPRKRRSRPHRPAGTPLATKPPSLKSKGNKPAAIKPSSAKRRVGTKKATPSRLRAALIRGRHSLALASLGLLMLVASCATPRIGESPSHSLALVPTDFDSLPGWNSDHLAEALPALQSSCATFAKWPDDRTVGKLAGSAGDWRPACNAAMAVSAGDNTGTALLLTTYFQPYAALDRTTDQGLFTGY